MTRTRKFLIFKSIHFERKHRVIKILNEGSPRGRESKEALHGMRLHKKKRQEAIRDVNTILQAILLGSLQYHKQNAPRPQRESISIRTC